MINDQKRKLLDSNNHPIWNDGFLLSWTLTIDTASALWSLTDPWSKTNILAMAQKAEPRIYEYMYKWGEEGKLTKTLFPNILYVDAFSRTTTNAAIYLNKLYDSLPPG